MSQIRKINFIFESINRNKWSLIFAMLFLTSNLKGDPTMKFTKLNIAMAMAVSASTIALVGCGADGKDGAVGATGEVYSTQLDFTEVAPAITSEEKNVIRTTTAVKIAGESQTLSYTRLMKTGDTDNGETFGVVKDYQDQPALASDGSTYLCNGTDEGVGSGLDHVSLLQKNSKIYMVSQFECEPGAMYMNEVTQNSSTGALSATPNTLKFVSQKEGFGGWVHCAGMTTPWQSHLGSEEYEPNARNILSSADDKYYKATVDAFWKGDDSKSSAYYYGWTPEVSVDASGNPVYTKHYSMGRFAHELAYVMPDQKTTYLTDDGTNGMLFMFVADTAGDLSAGTLYAAKWNQTSDVGAGAAYLTWISLGHATNAQIEALLNKDNDKTTGTDAIKFADIFDTETPVSGVCPTPGDGLTTGFKSVNTSWGNECLKLKDINGDSTVDAADQALAGRLESRRMGAILGATSEFRKKEGITFNDSGKVMYIAMSQIGNGMEDNNASNDLGGNNDIKLTKNSCGAVYSLGVATDTTIGSDYVAYNMKGLVAGIPTTYSSTSALSGNTCDVDGIANPDNVTFLEGTSTLIIGEDTDMHPNDMVWSYDINTGKMQRIATGPFGSEMTNSYWYKDINGFGYLTNTAQHPFGEVSSTYVRPTGVESKTETGVIGPFNFSKLK
ncbi:alkaline phosphatase PhoX [Thiosulfativibrio zosterae]|uniref:Alkaline phosphatase n=1 Tax=Thiosulfativibrio zosterae TaxID=2675053 RepID=A0A6F8PP23_9GAMM|nr:alkaline phosphatase PhoX [Thiosulfativibrio zosterae]BBP43871.1 alkaline phosphatase [Thiosulfativibrio zosterae]